MRDTAVKKILPLAVVLSACLLFSAMTSAVERQLPNIILCMADDQGWGDVGYYGNPIPKTPTLDAMAKSSLRLDRFYSAAPVCSPTRGSVLTGRHPNRFGCFTWGRSLRPQEITVAEALKTAGYATGHFGKWHLGSVRADSSVSPGGSGFDRWLSAPNFYENDPLMSRNGKVVQVKGESSQIAVDEALDFIRDATKRKQPFLAVIWFGSPHSPHISAEKNLEHYKGLPKKLQHYYGEITGIDNAMGNLRSELREMNIADDTLLWYTSDNGPQGPAGRAGSAGNLSGRKGSLWEGGVRVPTIIEWPGRIKNPRISSLPGNTFDIYPTLLEITGVTMPGQPQLDGVSLLPLIDGTMKDRGKAMGFWVYPARGIPMRSSQMLQEMARKQKSGRPLPAPADPGKITEKYSKEDLPGNAAWIDGDYKLLHRRLGKNATGRYLLFDLGNDPQEKNDLSEKQPERVANMKAAMLAWKKSVIGSLNGEDYGK